jgi:hypothetical protein
MSMLGSAMRHGVIVSLTALVWTAGLAARDIPISTDGSDPKSWDPALDGVLAAPAHHDVVYEDDNVRVMKAR